MNGSELVRSTDVDADGEIVTAQSHAANVMAEVASARAVQEVQAAMVVAKRFPRDETASLARIKRACQRRGLAECSHYEYPKGGSIVRGPTIRLAEALAQNWGNIDFGVIELEQRPGESTMMAFAWDLETNTRRQTTFTVRHVRRTKREGDVAITDPRDVYEHIANQGSRRLRTCILSMIPGDFISAACDECDRTLASGHDKPREDRIRDMLVAFRNDFGVTREMIEARFGHNADVTTETELVTLRRLYQSLRDGVAQVGDVFAPTPTSTTAERVGDMAQDLADKLAKEVATVGRAVTATASATPTPSQTTAPLPDPGQQTFAGGTEPSNGGASKPKPRGR